MRRFYLDLVRHRKVPTVYKYDMYSRSGYGPDDTLSLSTLSLLSLDLHDVLVLVLYWLERVPR